MSNWTTQEAARKRAATIAARKNDTGCECHGRPLCECPNYKPQVWQYLLRTTTVRRSA